MILIQAKKDELLKPLQTVTGVVERKHTLPILSNVLIENENGFIKFIGTDLEIQIITIGSQVGNSNFRFTTNARKLQDILRAIPSNVLVSLEIKNNQLVLKAASGIYNLQILDANEFPLINVSDKIKSVLTIKQKDLFDLLSQVQYSMAIQDIRFYLNGLLMQIDDNKLKLVSTDGNRLAYSSVDLKENVTNCELIIPRKSVLELLKMLNFPDAVVIIEFLDEQIRFKCNDTVIISKLIDGKFPDYNKVIPLDNNIIILLQRVELLNALERVNILANEKLRGVRFVIQSGLLRIICNNSEQEEAQEDIKIIYDGDFIEISYNISYIMEMLRSINSHEIQMSLGKNNSSTLFSIPENYDFKYIVMPMKI